MQAFLDVIASRIIMLREACQEPSLANLVYIVSYSLGKINRVDLRDVNVYPFMLI